MKNITHKIYLISKVTLILLLMAVEVYAKAFTELNQRQNAMRAEDVGTYWEANAEAWIAQVRAGFDVYRDLINTPGFLSILPNVAGLRGLDMGCGEGANTRKIAEQGARMTGIDISPTFIKHASEATCDHTIAYEVGDATALNFADESFDFTVAFMSLMDMPDQDKALREAYRVTKRGGFLQFSILHPCFVPTQRKTVRNENGEATGVLINDYFTETNGEIERWHFSAAPADVRAKYASFSVPRFHRTLSSWVAYLSAAGWVIEAFHEPRATPEIAEKYPYVADTMIAPLFLIVRARKV